MRKCGPDTTHSTVQETQSGALQLTQWWIWIWVPVLGSNAVVFSLKHGSPLRSSRRGAVLRWCEPRCLSTCITPVPVFSPTEPWARPWMSQGTPAPSPKKHGLLTLLLSKPWRCCFWPGGLQEPPGHHREWGLAPGAAGEVETGQMSLGRR